MVNIIIVFDEDYKNEAFYLQQEISTFEDEEIEVKSILFPYNKYLENLSKITSRENIIFVGEGKVLDCTKYMNQVICINGLLIEKQGKSIHLSVKDDAKSKYNNTISLMHAKGISVTNNNKEKLKPKHFKYGLVGLGINKYKNYNKVKIDTLYGYLIKYYVKFEMHNIWE